MSRFMDLEMLTAPGVLVPRSETELLARQALRICEELGGGALQVIDMCCGSGNLACAVATLQPSARVFACDLTEPCVALTRRNVAHHQLEARVTVHQGDLFGGLSALGLEGQIDLVICNPPYISTGRLEKDRAHLLDSEPREAFDGGPYGLTIHQRVLNEAQPFLRPGGWLMFEFGAGQDRQMKLLFGRAKAYQEAQLIPDGAGENRVIVGRKKVV